VRSGDLALGFFVESSDYTLEALAQSVAAQAAIFASVRLRSLHQ
jgi:hypothetical protein